MLTERTITDCETNHYPLDAKDRFGRVIGAIVVTCMVVCTPSRNEYFGYDDAPGNYFGFRPSGARDSLPYGGGQCLQLFTTEAARAKAIQKYLAGARKRAQKRAGK